MRVATRAMWARRPGVTRDHSGSSPRAAAASTGESRSSPASVEATPHVRFENRPVPDGGMGDVVVATELDAAPDPAVDDAAAWPDDRRRSDVGRPFEDRTRIDDRVPADPHIHVDEDGLGEEEGRAPV